MYKTQQSDRHTGTPAHRHTGQPAHRTTPAHQIDSYVEPIVDMIPMLNFYGKIFFSNAPNKNEREKHKKYTTTNSSGLIFTERGWIGAAAVERTRSRFHYEGGLQQVGFIFFLIHPTFF